MAPVFLKIGGTAMNALTFSGTNLLISKLMDHGKKKHKRHDFAPVRLQRAREKWDKHRIKYLENINKELREKNEARTF